MPVEVIIQRTFKDKAQAEKLVPLILKLRSLATVQPGYITGQTLRCLDCKYEYMVISTWNRREDWNNWFDTPERRELQAQIDQLLGEETQYRFFEPLVGGILPVFKDRKPAHKG
ncbi:MAG: antibiotic biosynthesis monooxygenase [Desulfobacterales bacterium]